MKEKTKKPRFLKEKTYYSKKTRPCENPNCSVHPDCGKEKSLSDEMVNPYTNHPYKAYILVTDLKQAIKRLKWEIKWRIKAMNRNEYTPQQTSRNIKKEINKIFGDKLTNA